MFARLEHWLSATERAAAMLALASMVAIMLVVTADVVMRYAFGHPFAWAYDLIALYLMGGAFYLVLADAYRMNAHVSIDVLQHHLPAVLRRVAALASSLAGLAVFALIAWLGAERAWESFANDEVMAGTIPWPMGFSTALVPVGAGVLVLRLALTVLGHGLSLVTGKEFLPADGPATGECIE